jgi:hypothetical protein
MKNSITKSIVLLSTVAVSSCGLSHFSTRQTNPAIVDFQGFWPFSQVVSTESVDASRRINVMRLDDANKNYDQEKWRDGEFCAEPPPDALANTASQFVNDLAAKINIPQAGGGEGSGNWRMIQEIASSMAPLMRRSQGLQFERDVLSHACNAYLNRAINKEQYLKLILDTLNKSEGLIKAEMEHLPTLEWKITEPPKAPVLSATPEPIKP